MDSEEPQLDVMSDPLTRQCSLADTGLRKFFEAAVRFESSDLLMRGGVHPKLRIRGGLKSLDTPPVALAQFEEWIEKSLTPAQWKRYMTRGSVDIGFDLDLGAQGGTHRFRVNVFRTRGRSALAARRVSNKILNFEELHLPASLGTMTDQAQGLILLAGITGSGKSTTIASMLQRINETRACHIVTLEDPIEYLFTDSKSMFNQREIGLDCASRSTCCAMPASPSSSPVSACSGPVPRPSSWRLPNASGHPCSPRPRARA